MFIFVFLTCFILSCASGQVSDCEGNDSIEKGIDNIYFPNNELKGINIIFLIHCIFCKIALRFTN